MFFLKNAWKKEGIWYNVSTKTDKMR